MCYLGKWDPNEYPLIDILKTALVNLEVVLLVCCYVICLYAVDSKGSKLLIPECHTADAIY